MLLPRRIGKREHELSVPHDPGLRDDRREENPNALSQVEASRENPHRRDSDLTGRREQEGKASTGEHREALRKRRANDDERTLTPFGNQNSLIQTKKDSARAP